MRLKSTILLIGVAAIAVAGAALAQDAAPPVQAQAGPQGPRGGAPGGPQGGNRPAGAPGQAGPGQERAPPSVGGVVGTVDSVSGTSFEMTTSLDRKATVELSPTTTYRTGNKASSASAVKKGERVLAIGVVVVGRGGAGTTFKAEQVVVQPVGLDKATLGQTGAVRGSPPVVKEVGKPVATYVQGEGTIISGPEAHKAIETALGAWTGGYINRVVKLKTGEYEVHNVGVDWPHHIFVDKGFKYLGAK